jgi:hypothetical protein
MLFNPSVKATAPAALSRTDLGHLLALEAFGQCRHGDDVNDRGVARAAQDEIDDGVIVDHRIGVGLADHGGDAARGGSLARGGEASRDIRRRARR